jgi:DNA-binding NarL/FixJ family response regulator
MLALSGLALGLRWSDHLEEAQRALDRAAAIARRRGSTTDFAVALTLRAQVHHRAGRLRDAEADARGAAAAAIFEPEWTFARGVGPLVASLVDQGRAEDAAQALADAGLDGEIPDSPPMHAVLLTRVGMRAAQRDYDGALADWRLVVDRVERRGGINAAWIEDFAAVADVHLARGDGAAAKAAADHALELAQSWGTPAALGQALHAQARVGAAEDPVPVLRQAVSLLSRSPQRLQHARALATLGGLLRRSGRRVDSRDPLREAYALARQCGAEDLAESARGELRASGIRLRRAEVTGADALTPSERRIADLATEGLSNAEIAQALFLTLKTVEMHLTNTFRKLEVHGRRELGVALAAKP